VSSMEEKAKPSAKSPRSATTLTGLLSKLEGLLRAVNDDAQRMDASLKDAHKLVEGIWRAVFGEGGALDPREYEDNYRTLKRDREAENDMHEVYASALERYQRRRARDLGVAESDSDTLALVRRRREYISKLEAFKTQASSIGDYLSGRSS
jgi:hypothetical protein